MDLKTSGSPTSRSRPRPGSGEVALNIKTVGVCGSDLHMYETGRIGYTNITEPFILGHEFMGEIVALGPDALDGEQQPLQVGQRVAVEPAVPCWRCELCEHGHPNLCPNHYFYGLFPDDGALRERMLVSARNCFPMPDSLGDDAGPLLETLGVAIHAIDLSKIRNRPYRSRNRRRPRRRPDHASGCAGRGRARHRLRQAGLAPAKSLRLGRDRGLQCRSD